ncbi:MAG: 50S ribosomal protein L18 [Bacteroidota bacterium]|jgi:large subunit ribosomal protein L18|uniref:50S ribosomal protein L18 n=1 Tax=Candidatus Pollutiaquabacter sp. TaxID=3416354 RepID=UPI001A3F0506|nr:50S ribosomal protein L18 [Bacteroidota bacterium]MBL7949346.1 50S ribosomal protein L18 [Bacteroidia bacterium]MBP6009483.1 50S ribosomal protein L18 [Bacteroidia bacterium]MBP7268736.1 50S ribosomal protein L18 [Bacteroidia bacterium]MBP7437264.1 50S ribosomal protein L18 [Bacteroidia bacterium]
MLKKQQRRSNIRYRIRKTVKGTAERPRLSVFRSNKQIYAQLIDDVQGVTLAAVSSAAKEMTATKGPKVDLAREVGKKIAEKAVQSGIKTCVFDRGGYLYHGRVKALAEGAREAGLQF